MGPRGAPVVAYENDIMMLGGTENINTYATSGRLSRSQDGINWRRQFIAAFIGSYGAAAVYKGDYYHVGGVYLQGNNIFNIERIYKTPVDSELVSWQIAQMNAPYGPRLNAQLLVADDKLVMMGGNNGSAQTRDNDIWSTENGQSWTKINSTNHWSGREYFQAVAFDTLPSPYLQPLTAIEASVSVILHGVPVADTTTGVQVAQVTASGGFNNTDSYIYDLIQGQEYFSVDNAGALYLTAQFSDARALTAVVRADDYYNETAPDSVTTTTYIYLPYTVDGGHVTLLHDRNNSGTPLFTVQAAGGSGHYDYQPGQITPTLYSDAFALTASSQLLLNYNITQLVTVVAEITVRDVYLPTLPLLTATVSVHVFGLAASVTQYWDSVAANDSYILGSVSVLVASHSVTVFLTGDSAVTLGSDNQISVINAPAGVITALLIVDDDELITPPLTFTISVQAVSTQDEQSEEQMYIIGGERESFGGHDVLVSQDGIDWHRILNRLPFTERSGHQAVYFNDRIYVIGGREFSSGQPFLGDIWSSADGRTWRLETTAPAFGKRYGHKVAVFNNQLVLIGGHADGVDYDDVWVSEDGVNWTIMPSPGLGARYLHAAAVYNGTLVVIGGVSNSRNNYYGDIWYTSDLENWQEFTPPNAEHYPSLQWGYAAAAAVPATDNNDGGVYFVGGVNSSLFNISTYFSADAIHWHAQAHSSSPAKQTFGQFGANNGFIEMALVYANGYLHSIGGKQSFDDSSYTDTTYRARPVNCRRLTAIPDAEVYNQLYCDENEHEWQQTSSGKIGKRSPAVAVRSIPRFYIPPYQLSAFITPNTVTVKYQFTGTVTQVYHPGFDNVLYSDAHTFLTVQTDGAIVLENTLPAGLHDITVTVAKSLYRSTEVSMVLRVLESFRFDSASVVIPSERAIATITVLQASRRRRSLHI